MSFTPHLLLNVESERGQLFVKNIKDSLTKGSFSFCGFLQHAKNLFITSFSGRFEATQHDGKCL